MRTFYLLQILRIIKDEQWSVKITSCTRFLIYIVCSVSSVTTVENAERYLKSKFVLNQIFYMRPSTRHRFAGKDHRVPGKPW